MITTGLEIPTKVNQPTKAARKHGRMKRMPPNTPVAQTSKKEQLKAQAHNADGKRPMRGKGAAPRAAQSSRKHQRMGCHDYRWLVRGLGLPEVGAGGGSGRRDWCKHDCGPKG